jgi:hypothetical protein
MAAPGLPRGDVVTKSPASIAIACGSGVRTACRPSNPAQQHAAPTTCRFDPRQWTFLGIVRHPARAATNFTMREAFAANGESTEGAVAGCYVVLLTQDCVRDNPNFGGTIGRSCCLPSNMRRAGCTGRPQFHRTGRF